MTTRARKPSIVTWVCMPRSGSSSRSPTIRRDVFGTSCERFHVSCSAGLRAPSPATCIDSDAGPAATGGGAPGAAAPAAW